MVHPPPPHAQPVCILPLLAFRLLVLTQADDGEDEVLALLIISMDKQKQDLNKWGPCGP